ncbi:MAG: PRC-barrel domain-containing protein [Roseiarcus sp.]
MLQVISALKGLAIEASDGRMGTVVDFLFDDASWKVRWLVVDCGTWLKGRKVLIHPLAVSDACQADDRFEVKLTKAQVEGSPECFEHQPVSQQMQSRLYEYYGWEPAWGSVAGAVASPMLAPPYLGLQTAAEPGSDIGESHAGDPHLRSVVEVIGYHIHATDGDIGQVENFMLDREGWSLPYFVVDTSNWWFGNRVLIATHSVEAIKWSDRHVSLGLSREQIKTRPPWDPLVAFDEIYATHLHRHYGWPMSQA